MIQQIFIKGTLPSLNETINAARSHWSIGAKHKKDWQTQVMLQIKTQRVKPIDKCFLSFNWIEKNQRRDPDNIAAGGRKIILDSLQELGILENDGWKQILGWEDRFSVDKENSGVLILIRSEDL